MRIHWGLTSLALCLALACAASAGAQTPTIARVDALASDVHDPAAIPSAFRILDARLLVPRFLDGAPSCLTSLAPLAARSTKDPEQDFLDLAAATQRARHEDVHELRTQVHELVDRTDGLVRACLYLESARLHLRARFGPEALAEILRARRSLEEDEWLPSMRDVGNYYEAEARLLIRDEANPGDGFEALTRSAFRSVAAAARLRVIEQNLRDDLAKLDDTAAGAAWATLRGTLEEARQTGLDSYSWAPLTAEVAIRAGHLAEAHRWLAVAEGAPDSGDAAAIRKAEVLVALDRPDEARSTLRRVRSLGRSEPTRALAALRMARLGLVTDGSDERIALLERAARTEHPTIRMLALERLTRERLAEGDPDAALALLRQLSHSARDEIVEPLYGPAVDSVLDAAIDSADCSQILARLSSSWENLLFDSTRDEAFSRIGDCYLDMGMGADALAVFRGLVRRFGADAIADVSWRVARASLDAGDLPAARAAIRAQQKTIRTPQIQSQSDARWRWLAARLARMEGRDLEAEEFWLALASSQHLPPDLRGHVELQLIRHWRNTEDERFEEALQRSLAEPAWVDAGVRAYLQVQLADRNWVEGRRNEALALYRSALGEVDTPTARSRAAYRNALAAGGNDRIREALREAGREDRATPWSRLARSELRMMDLRQAIGRDAQVEQ